MCNILLLLSLIYSVVYGVKELFTVIERLRKMLSSSTSVVIVVFIVAFIFIAVHT